MVDRATKRRETGGGPREVLLPSGQAAGRWYFPPPLCADDTDAARPGPGNIHMPDYLQQLTHARGDQRLGVRKDQCRDRQIAEWINWLCENGSVVGRC